MLKSDNKKAGFAGKRLTAGWNTSHYGETSQNLDAFALIASMENLLL